MSLMKHREGNQVKWIGVRPAHRGEQVFAYDINISGEVIDLYEVPAGKILFITSSWLQVWTSAANGGALGIRDTTPDWVYYLLSYEDDGAYHAEEHMSYPFPIEVPAGYFISMQCFNANGETRGGFAGWIEDA